ncbi:MAG: hypothetical protein QW735_02635 [archaeon]
MRNLRFTKKYVINDSIEQSSKKETTEHSTPENWEIACDIIFEEQRKLQRKLTWNEAKIALEDKVPNVTEILLHLSARELIEK